VKNPDKIAPAIVRVIGGSVATYEQQLATKNTRYVVLGTKLTQSQDNAILGNKFAGIGTQGQDYRTYPQGSLASQTLGFVNNSGQGEYGLEQALNNELAGKPGQLKAVTDINGVPLAADGNNISIPPTNGDNVVTTLDMGMQTQMEQILQNEYKATKSQGISAIIMDPSTGQVKAMANYPTYNPADYEAVSNPALFQNAAVDNAIEPGSTMKTLTTSAALDQGVITPNESFYDPAHWVIDGFNITDIEEDGGARQQNIASILNLSLNTGATWMLMQMSDPGGTTITQKGIDAWNNYMVNHFRLGQLG
jgi:stage V sporulation protein D (sporulation-specific penicillin-binding protein)